MRSTFRGNSLINREHWIDGWRDSWPHLRRALQTAVAACLAYAAVELLQLPQGFWAVVTAIMVMQANVGASLGQAFDRLLGSLLGVLLGGAIAIVLADAHVLKYAGLAATVFVLVLFSARRPPLRIACVTAAIVILGDPRLGSPISSAYYRMIEVMIGAAVASLTSLLVFPSRAGPALAEHVRRTLALNFELLREILTAALTGRYDEQQIGIMGAKIRSAIAMMSGLADETKLELAGHLADHPDPDAAVRAVRRLWHTEVILLRAVSAPFADAALAVMQPRLERLCLAVGDLSVCYGSQALEGEEAPTDSAAVERALGALEQELSGFRAKGGLRALSMDDVIRLMTFDFALAQLGTNLKDLRDRGADLVGFSGSSIPWLQGLRGAARNWRL